MVNGGQAPIACAPGEMEVVLDDVAPVELLLEELVLLLDMDVAAEPMAIEEEMEGLLVVMKLPKMVWKARAKSGPMLEAPWTGPKYAETSEPWRAGGTENWYFCQES